MDVIEKEHSDGAVKKTFMRKEVTLEIRTSYNDICAMFLFTYRVGDSPVSIVL